jgi:hypothetical protein
VSISTTILLALDKVSLGYKGLLIGLGSSGWSDCLGYSGTDGIWSTFMNGWYRAGLAVGLTVALGSCSTAVVETQEQGVAIGPSPTNLPTATVVL